MKHFLTLFIILSILCLIGCTTTRKTTRSSTSEQTITRTTTTAGTNTENTNAVNTRTNLNEHLSAVIDFTRYEYSDGTIQDMASPATLPDSIRPRNREQTEPTNPGRNLVAVTTGRINLNKDTEQTEETEATNETKHQTSLASQNDKTFDSSKDTDTTEKPDNNLTHRLEIIIGGLIACFAIYGGLAIITRIRTRLKNGIRDDDGIKKNS